MHAVQSALAIRRERERRQSLKAQKNNNRKASTDTTASVPPINPSDFRHSPESNGSFNYTTVGISFIIFGTLMIIPIFAGAHEALGLDWRHLLGIGGLLIAIGVLMIVVKLLTDDDSNVQERLDKYKPRMGRSGSQNPIIEDVEYGLDSRRNSINKNINIPKDFEAAAENSTPASPIPKMNGVVKV